ncbi:MAG TPA: hypothetical protein VNM69_15860 [Bacillus sp. (in: firmicutes)]|uniref:hypothetical protein n=1 Tax=Bacillus litorisediminis TaxID=2922713 RepID=UPI001FAE85F2|nr:hypothetical protein [Bacillus litorisediminis]HWO77341.1 hypothetical protein [Bacillus sp. (in: firmicutes)]
MSKKKYSDKKIKTEIEYEPSNKFNPIFKPIININVSCGDGVPPEPVDETCGCTAEINVNLGVIIATGFICPNNCQIAGSTFFTQVGSNTFTATNIESVFCTTIDNRIFLNVSGTGTDEEGNELVFNATFVENPDVGISDVISFISTGFNNLGLPAGFSYNQVAVPDNQLTVTPCPDPTP